MVGVFLKFLARASKLLNISYLRLASPRALEISHQGFLGMTSPEIDALSPVIKASSNLACPKY